jgi:hypothetical protein
MKSKARWAIFAAPPQLANKPGDHLPVRGNSQPYAADDYPLRNSE